MLACSKHWAAIGATQVIEVLCKAPEGGPLFEGLTAILPEQEYDLLLLVAQRMKDRARALLSTCLLRTGGPYL